MLDNILVPLDGSSVGEVGLRYAQAIVERTHGRLTLLHAAGGLSSGNAATPKGPPAQSIIDEIASRNIDLVVMATHDPTGARRWPRGSVAETVIGQTAVPVLLIRASSGAALAERFRSQRPVLVVPLDGSELAEAALPVARDFAVGLSARVVLVGIVPHVGLPATVRRGAPASSAEQEFQQVEGEARAYLESMANQLGSELECGVAVRSGEPAREIDREADESGAAAIVMATHGRTGILRALLGSVAGEVVHSTSTPVLLVHALTSPQEDRSGRRRIGWGLHVDDARTARGQT